MITSQNYARGVKNEHDGRDTRGRESKRMGDKIHIEKKRKEAPARGSRLNRIAIPIILLLILIAFFPVLKNGFVNWDDFDNLVRNPRCHGFSVENFQWMFTTFHMSLYRPLFWLFLAAIYQGFELNARSYHLASLFFHMANAVVFFFLCLQVLRWTYPSANRHTGFHRCWGALFAALFFALHPMRVEAVAWVSAFNDLIAGLFLLLSLLFYFKRFGEEREKRGFYRASLLMFLLSLLSKATGMVFPLILLLMDYYPLRRLRGGPGSWFASENRSVWVEKIPFFLLGILAAVGAVIGKTKALAPLVQYGPVERLAHMFLSMIFYLYKTFFPLNLSPLVQLRPESSPLDWPFLAGGVLFTGITLFLIGMRRKWPGGLAVWLCYVVFILPVSGIAQTGAQFVADRYSYLACLGIAVMMGWLLLFLLSDTKARHAVKYPAAIGAVIILFTLGVLTWRQTKIWQDSETLWEFALSIDPRSSIAHHNYGIAMLDQGNIEESIRHFEAALRIEPFYTSAHYNLGNIMVRSNRLTEAEKYFKQALKIDPEYFQAIGNLAGVYYRQGNLPAAAERYKETIQRNPGDPVSHYNLANIHDKMGRPERAVEAYRMALQLDPALFQARVNLANILMARGEAEEAIKLYREALRSRDDIVEAHLNLAGILTARGALEEAVQHLEKVVQLQPDNLDARKDLAQMWLNLDRAEEAEKAFRALIMLEKQNPALYHNLGIALTKQGKFSEACSQYEEALRLNPDLVQSRFLLGLVLSRSGRGDEAIPHLEHALKLQPDFAEAEQLLRSLQEARKNE